MSNKKKFKDLFKKKNDDYDDFIFNGPPISYKKDIHVGIDANGNICGLPSEYQVMLNISGITLEEQRCYSDIILQILDAQKYGTRILKPIIQNNIITSEPPKPNTLISETSNSYGDIITTKTNLNDYTDFQIVGGAKYATYIAKEVSTMNSVVISSWELSKCDKNIVLKNIELANLCKHPNIINLKEYFIYEDSLYFISEYIEEGYDLMQYIDNEILIEYEIAYITKKVLLTLQYLHNQNIIYNILKSENIYIDKNHIKINLDFVNFKNNRQFIGTPYWLAPEILTNQNPTFQSDIWSLGILVYEMLNNQPPLMDLTPIKAQFVFCTGNIPFIKDNISDDAKHFILQCLMKNPQDRSDIQSLLMHPFITQVTEEIDYHLLSQKLKEKQDTSIDYFSDDEIDFS